MFFATLDPSTSLRMTRKNDIRCARNGHLFGAYLYMHSAHSERTSCSDCSTPPHIYIERVRVRVQLCACTRAIVCAYMRVYMRVYILCVHARARVYKNTLVKAGGAGRI